MQAGGRILGFGASLASIAWLGAAAASQDLSPADAIDLFLGICTAAPGDALSIESAAFAAGFVRAPPAMVDAMRRLYPIEFVEAYVRADGVAPPLLVPIMIDRNPYRGDHLVCALDLTIGDGEAARASVATRMDDAFPYGISEEAGGTNFTWTSNSIAARSFIELFDRRDISGFVLTFSTPFPS